MKIKNYKDIDLKTEEEAKGAGIRWLLSDRDGMTDMAMRVIEIEPGGQTPLHSHPWEHQVFALKGSGRVMAGGARGRDASLGRIRWFATEVGGVSRRGIRVT